jgi:hypothetical protein
MSHLSLSFQLLFFIAISIFNFSTISSTEFDFGTLTLTSLKLLGDAHLNNGTVTLTRDLTVPFSGAGQALYSRPIKFRQPGTTIPASFTTFFSFSVTNLNPSSIGGGLAFVVTPDADSLGNAGGYLGLATDGFIAVEFDTLMDVEFKDIMGIMLVLILIVLFLVKLVTWIQLGLILKVVIRLMLGLNLMDPIMGLMFGFLILI